MKKILFLILIISSSLFATYYDDECRPYTEIDSSIQRGFSSKDSSEVNKDVCNALLNTVYDGYYIYYTKYSYDSHSTKPYSCLYRGKKVDTSKINPIKTCEDGLVLDTDTCSCEEPPECKPEPKPKDLYTIKIVSGSEECRNLQEQGTFTTEDGNVYEHLACWHNSCATDLEHADYTLMGELKECTPMTSYTASISKDMCSGMYKDWDKGVSGQLGWQECDSTCYILEPIFLKCNDALSKYLSECDQDLNNFTFHCTDSSDNNSSYALTSECTPKNQDPISSPCDSAFNDKKNECDSLNKKLEGKCTDNGMIILFNTLKCVDDIPDCSSEWNEELSTDKTECVCKDGYIRNDFGDCWKPLFPDDGNLTDEQRSTNRKAEQDNHLAKVTDDGKPLKNNNDIDLNTTNNTLAGIRHDLNTTNNILSDIKNKLDSNVNITDIDSSDLDDVKSFYDNITNEYKDFSVNVQNQISDIVDRFENAKSLFESGHTFSEANIGEDPIFETEVFGETISIDLCPTFSYFAPFVYFIMVGFFMVKVFFFTFNHFMKGFN